MLYLKISGNSPEETKYLKKYYSEKAHAWNKEIKKNKILIYKSYKSEHSQQNTQERYAKKPLEIFNSFNHF